MEKLGQKLPTLKKGKLNQKKEEENTIKRRITEASQKCCDWKFQIHWNKLEWVNPRRRYERKSIFCVFKK